MASKSTTDKAMESLGPLAQLLNKTAGDLWKIFVWRYIAIGVSSLIVAVLGMGYLMYLMGPRNPWLLFPIAIFLSLLYWALQNLINPYYPAMNDVIKHVQAATKPKPVEVVGSNFRLG